MVIAKTLDEAEKLFEILNQLHPNIKLTMEHETESRIAFLDIELFRNDDGIVTRSVHRKHTWTGQYLHFSSFIPVKYKKRLVKTLFDRARRICSPDTLPAELKRLVMY